MGIKLSGMLYLKMIQGGAAILNKNREIVNNLNVFPIPDGDTGDNMYMTIKAGAGIEASDMQSLESVAKAAEKAMLLGARGNSGVILSRIFSGLSKGFAGLSECDFMQLSKAFEMAVFESYGAVDTPVDGTILSVFRDAVKFANERISEDSSLEEYIDNLLAMSKESLERTPDQLAVLKDAGVVDSGGAGLVCIFEGMKSALCGDISVSDDYVPSKQSNVDLSLFTENSVLDYGYCTEFLLRLQNSKVGNVEDFDESLIKNYLSNVGDSLVFFRDDSIIKVHVHTMNPGNILNECQKYGEFLTLKIENMCLQHSQKESEGVYKAPKIKKKYGIVTVVSGNGMKDLFKSLNSDVYVVDGGQSMNPSSEDFIKVYNEINAETIFVFPNNSNIILAAKQSAEFFKESDIVVIESKTIGDGYVGIGAIDTDLDKEANIEAIQENMESVLTAAVSVASRDTQSSGVQIYKDHYIGFVGKQIFCDSPDINSCARDLLWKIDVARKDIVIMIVGKDVPKDSADLLYEELTDKYIRTEIIKIQGDQPVYDYIFIIE